MKFHHAAIETKYLDRSCQFYKTLGFRLESEVEWMGEKIYFLQLDDFRLELIEIKEDIEPKLNQHLAFEVDDFEDILTETADLMLYEGPYSLKNGWETAFFLGPNRELIELLQISKVDA